MTTTKASDRERPCPVIRIALCEDHALVREGLKALLQSEPSFELVGEAADGVETLRMVESTQPDVLLLDLRIPRMHGVEVLRQLKGRTKVVVVSMHADQPFLVEALRFGVAGYVLKSCSREELISAIRAAADGGHYVCQELRSRAILASLRNARSGQQLTKREQMVLQLAAEGCSSSHIAATLFISTRTAEAHRANLMRKLGLKSQTELVLYAVRQGIVMP